MAHIIGFTGYSDSGKTTVVSRLITILKQRGYRVAAIKHAAHGYDMDIPGKDSWHHFTAGADQVMVAGPDSFTIHERLPQPPRLSELIGKMAEVDYILVEGFKEEAVHKVEIIREGKDYNPFTRSEELLAIVSDIAIDKGVPCFDLKNLDTLADYVIKLFPAS